MIRRIIYCLFVFICLIQASKATNVTIAPLTKDTICTGKTVTLKGSIATGTVTAWLWTVDSITGVTILPNDSAQNITASFADTGTYVITLYVHFSTAAIDSQKVTIHVMQSASALLATSGISSGIPQTVIFTNASTHAPNGFIWNFGDNGTLTQNTVTNASHTYNAAGAYTVSLIAYGVYGCNDTARTSLIATDTAGLSMPNVFTPNADGINDIYVPNAHGMKTLDCTIYDRWGAKIIDMDMNMQYWDGYTTSGLPCSAGTYFYVITATDVNGKSYSLKGYIQLIR